MAQAVETVKGKLGTVLLIVLGAITVLSVGVCLYLTFSGGETVEPKLVLYEGPKSLGDATPADLETAPENKRDITLKHCTDTAISVNGYDAFVYDTNVNNGHTWSSDYIPALSRTPMTYFDFEGKAQIKITLTEAELTSAVVTPKRYGIQPKVDAKNKTIEFTVTEPGFYTVELNGSIERAIHIFANPIEQNPPKQGDEGVVYIGPGEWNIDTIDVEDGQTLYLAGGAVVHGMVRAKNVNNVKILGRGIIDGSYNPTWKGTSALLPMIIDGCDGVEVEGIILLNSNAWVVNSLQTSNATLSNIKIISCRPNGDGISLQSCKNYTVQNSFVRSWDDSLVVKNYADSTEGIHFKGVTIWTDLAQSMEVGYETNRGNTPDAFIKDVSFEDITVLHNFHKPVISIHNADDALIEGVTYKNITVEDAAMGAGDAGDNKQLIDIAIVKNDNWSTTQERGQVRDVTIDGVTVLGGSFPPSRIIGYDDTHTVEGVTIKNLQILGKRIASFEEGQFEIDSQSTKNIVIE